MLDEATFRRESDRALEPLKQSLIAAEEDSLPECLLREHLNDSTITLA